MRVQINKQYRWLIFLLVPFVSMIIIHFMIPYQIMNHTFPLLEQQNSITRSHSEQNMVRQTTKSIQQSITFLFQHYFSFTNKIFSLVGSPLKYYSISKLRQINNAFQFSQRIQNQNLQFQYQQNLSMWFAEDKIEVDSLTQTQKIIMEQYKKIQPYLINLYNKEQLLKISLLLSMGSQKMIFEYPSMYNRQFAKLEQPLIQYYFEKARLNYPLDQNSYIAFSERQSDNQQIATCKLILQSQIIDGLVCFSVKTLQMEEIFRRQTKPINQQILKTTHKIVGPIYSSQNYSNPQILFQLKNDNDTQLKQNKSFYQNLRKRKNIFNSSSKIKTQQIFRQNIQNQMTIIYIDPIILASDQNQNILMYLVTQNIPQLQISINQNTFQDNLTPLVISTIVLIIVSSGVSIIILKKLLNSIEYELQELHYRCQFILDGDLAIEIPNYEGTQDIQMVYESVKIINKLHRYSTNSYFTGHWADKILKYNEALQVFRKLKYNDGCLLQNIGQCYLYIEECEESLKYLKQSLKNILNQINQEYEGFDVMYEKKIQKRKIPHCYKQLEVILIRRTFKLCWTYWKIIDLRHTMPKVDDFYEEEQNKKLKEKYTLEVLQYSDLLKKALYPDYSLYSESLMIFVFSAKQYLTMNNLELAQKCLQRFNKVSSVYYKQYDKNTKKLKQKGSKNKFFYQKNKLTYHSRGPPDVFKMLYRIFRAKYILASTQPHLYKSYSEVLSLYFQAGTFSPVTIGLTYMIALEVRKFLLMLKINTSKWESTQIFKQSVPFKTLFYGEINPATENSLLRYPTKGAEGLEREFVYIIDSSLGFENGQANYLKQRAHYVFEKLVKLKDRVSIVRINTGEGVKTQCNLLFKESGPQILKAEIQKAFKKTKKIGNTRKQLPEALFRVVTRIKNLQSQKIILFFLKGLKQYTEELQNKKLKRKISKYTNYSEDYTQKDGHLSIFKNIGKLFIQALQTVELRNTKVILFLSKEDKIQEARIFFGLEQINRKIWAKTEFINQANNVVYIIEDKHKYDIDRILMLKTQDVPDNHVFIF